MPEIIVNAGPRDEDAVLMRERVSQEALASEHYAAQLVERIGWAVLDASELEGAREARVDPAAKRR